MKSERGIQRRVATGLLVGFIALAAAGLHGRACAQQADAGLQPVSIQLRWYHQFQFAGYYLAKELDLYKRAGFAVTILPGGPGIGAVDAVVSGRADFGVANSGLLKARSEGAPVKATAAIFQKSPLRFIALENSGIDKASAMAGRRVTLLDNLRSLALSALLRKVGLTDQVIRINASFKVQDLIDGNTDVLNGYISNEPYALEKAGLAYYLIDPADYGLRFYTDVLFTRDALVEQSPEMVRRFSRASIEGWVYALDHPEHAIQVTRRYAPDRSVDHLRYEANHVRELVLHDLVSVGHMSPRRWDEIQNQLVASGLIRPADVIDVADLIFDMDEPGGRWLDNFVPLLIMGLLSVTLAIWLAMVARRKQSLEGEVVSSREAEAEAFRLATHDALTGLPNRLLLMDRLSLAFKQAHRRGHAPMLAFIDLDNFKQVNDVLGHDEGDQLLRLVARHVSRNCRSSETFARLGGDEFVLFADNVTRQAAELIGQRLLDSVRLAVSEFGTRLPVGASIGIVLSSDLFGTTPEDMIALADRAMYQVKKTGKGGIKVIDYPGPEADEPAGAGGTFATAE